METVNRLVSQIGDNRDLPPPAVLTSSASSELMSQQNQALKWLDKVFKLEATATKQKAIEWIQLIEANLLLLCVVGIRLKVWKHWMSSIVQKERGVPRTGVLGIIVREFYHWQVFRPVVLFVVAIRA